MIKEKDGEDQLKIKNILKNWFKNLEKYKLEKSIDWKIAIVKKINQFSF